MISVSQKVISQLITHASKRLRTCKADLLHWEPDPALKRRGAALHGGGDA